jgi:hypothetical protein
MMEIWISGFGCKAILFASHHCRGFGLPGPAAFSSEKHIPGCLDLI